jgi:hypothetical protein
VRTFHRLVDGNVEGVLVVLIFDTIAVLIVDVGARVTIEPIWAARRFDICDSASEAIAVVGYLAVFVAKNGEDGCCVAGAKRFAQNSRGCGFERREVIWRDVEIVEEKNDEAGRPPSWLWCGTWCDFGSRPCCIDADVLATCGAFFYGEARDLERFVFVEELKVGLSEVADGSAS